jgi:hypothetical protein
MSGFRNLDLATGGFQPKDLIIFTSFFEDEIRRYFGYWSSGDLGHL